MIRACAVNSDPGNASASTSAADETLSRWSTPRSKRMSLISESASGTEFHGTRCFGDDAGDDTIARTRMNGVSTGNQTV